MCECDDAQSCEDSVMSHKHFVSNPFSRLSSAPHPQRGVLIDEESTFNFSLSRLAVLSVRPLFFPLLNGIFQREATTQTGRGLICLQHLHTSEGMMI